MSRGEQVTRLKNQFPAVPDKAGQPDPRLACLVACLGGAPGGEGGVTAAERGIFGRLELLRAASRSPSPAAEFSLSEGLARSHMGPRNSVPLSFSGPYFQVNVQSTAALPLVSLLLPEQIMKPRNTQVFASAHLWLWCVGARWLYS